MLFPTCLYLTFWGHDRQTRVCNESHSTITNTYTRTRFKNTEQLPGIYSSESGNITRTDNRRAVYFSLDNRCFGLLEYYKKQWPLDLQLEIIYYITASQDKIDESEHNAKSHQNNNDQNDIRNKKWWLYKLIPRSNQIC